MNSSYFIVAGVAAVVSLACTPIVRAIVVKLGGYDIPTDRKLHLAPTPQFGGIAIYLGFAAAFLAASVLPPLSRAFRFSEALGLLFGGFILLVLGVLDDRHDLSWPAKLAGQIFASGIFYFSGLTMSFFWLPGIGVISLGPDLSAIFTIIWVTLLTNAVNYVDGLDGLAAGLSAIAATGLFFYSTRLPAIFLGPGPLAPLVAAAIAGACIGFLPLNFNPARIFMGDTGAMPLGYFLAGATISLIGRFNGSGASGGRLALPLIFTPIVFLAVPLTDVALATVRRLARGQWIFTADAEHIHHRLLRLGHSHRQAVLVMYAWAVLLTVGLIVAGTISWGRFVLASLLAVGTIVLLTLAPRLWGSSVDDSAPSAKVD
jgi:UDP-GlcNAc:undecaprenyl-phosphate GlcNAc-1-phosphate transferase